MLAFLQQMLNDITDLSSDDESPTMHTGGRRRALANGASGSKAAFLSGVTATQLHKDAAMGEMKMEPWDFQALQPQC